VIGKEKYAYHRFTTVSIAGRQVVVSEFVFEIHDRKS
jgi:hypothetical protein